MLIEDVGLDFFIQEIPSEVFTHSTTNPMSFLPPRTDIYPYLLVNIGSGVSMIKVSGPRAYQRIGGTSLGGGTLWGLLSLITGARNFDDMLAMAGRGDNTAVDMLVGDIYGSGYGKIGLKSDTIASSFGKVYKMKREAEREAEDGGGLSNEDGDDDHVTFRPEDISRSLLYAVRYVLVLHVDLLGVWLDSPLATFPLKSTTTQLQYWPNRISSVIGALARAHILWRFFHPWAQPDHGHALIRN